MTSASPPPENAQPAHFSKLHVGVLLWMRDPRRTPVRVLSVSEDTASFTVEVRAFEDIGAQWTFPLRQADKFLCAPDKPAHSAAIIVARQSACDQFDQPLRVPVDTENRTTSLSKLNTLTQQARDWLHNTGHHPTPDQPLDSFSAFQDPTALTNWLSLHEVANLETDFATHYISNPHAGETIKAHRLALADLGLCPFEGRILRDTAELTGPNSLAHRQRHILARLAFLRAAFDLLGQTHLQLYRVIYSDEPLTPPRTTGFVSTTFSREVALRFLKDGHSKRHAALYWQHVPVTRLFMTHLETPQMRRRYEESEALLLWDQHARLF